MYINISMYKKDMKKEVHPASKGMRSTVIGMLVNAMLAITKGAAGIIGNSYALIADAIESTTDIFSSLVVWFGLNIAKKPADKSHPYGHGKAEPMAAVIVSLALFAAAFVIIYQSIQELKASHNAPRAFTLIVLVMVVITKELLFRFVIGVGQETQSTAVKTDAWHHRSDAITSVAAFIGISIALVGGEKYARADEIAALFASAIIMFNAYRLLIPAIGELMDEAPGADIEFGIRESAKVVKGVISTEKCFVRKVGFDYFVDLHLIVNGKLTVEEGHNIAHKVKDKIRANDPRISNVLVHIEPPSELKKIKK